MPTPDDDDDDWAVWDTWAFARSERRRCGDRLVYVQAYRVFNGSRSSCFETAAYFSNRRERFQNPDTLFIAIPKSDRTTHIFYTIDLGVGE